MNEETDDMAPEEDIFSLGEKEWPDRLFKDDFIEILSSLIAERVKDKYVLENKREIISDVAQEMEREFGRRLPGLIRASALARIRSDIKLTAVATKRAVIDKVASAQHEAFIHMLESQERLMERASVLARKLESGSSKLEDIKSEFSAESPGGASTPGAEKILEAVSKHWQTLPPHLSTVVDKFLDAHAAMFDRVNDDIKKICADMFSEISIGMEDNVPKDDE